MSIQNDTQKEVQAFDWDIEISILANLRVWGDIFRIALIVYLTILVMFGLIFLPQREWELMALVAIVFPAAICGLLLVGVVLLTALTGNRFRMHYSVNTDGVACLVTDRRAQVLSRMTFLVGAMVGNLQATGTGILAMAGETQGIAWPHFTSARFLPQRRQIELKRGWRTHIVLYCPADIYASVAKFVSEQVAQEHPGGTQPELASLPRQFWRTLVLILATATLMLPVYPFEPDLVATIWLLLFGGVSIWLAPAAAYAMLLGIGEAVFRIGWVLAYGDVNFDTGGYGSLDSWGLQLALAIIGLCYLTWFSISTLIRRGLTAGK